MFGSMLRTLILSMNLLKSMSLPILKTEVKLLTMLTVKFKKSLKMVLTSSTSNMFTMLGLKFSSPGSSSNGFPRIVNLLIRTLTKL